MRRPLTPTRLVIGLATLVAFEAILSVAGFHYASRAKAQLQQSFPGQQVQLTGAAWVDVRCGSFRLGGDAPGVSHRFLENDTVPITTDLSNQDPAEFDRRWRACEHDAHGRGDWQDPIFDAVVLPRL